MISERSQCLGTLWMHRREYFWQADTQYTKDVTDVISDYHKNKTLKNQRKKDYKHVRMR